MSARWPRNVIVVNWEPAPYAAHYDERPPIGREYRSVVERHELRSGVTSRDLSRGKERDREGN